MFQAERWASEKQLTQPRLFPFAEHLEKALRPSPLTTPSKAEAYTCVPLSLRPDPGPEDGDGQEGGAAVFHEDVHGLTEVLHLQDEVCGGPGHCGWGGFALPVLPQALLQPHVRVRLRGPRPSSPHPTMSDFL